MFSTAVIGIEITAEFINDFARFLATQTGLDCYFITPDPHRESPTYYVEAGGCGEVVADVLKSRRWQRLGTGWESRSWQFNQKWFDLKWVRLTESINYEGLIEKQLVNHIPNHEAITCKDKFVLTLRSHEDATGRPFPWHPATYLSIEEADVTAALAEAEAQPETRWILKESDADGGLGIKMLRGAAELQRQLSLSPLNVVIQRYVERPLLLAGRKFDFRVYLLVARTAPYHLWFFHPGFCRVALVDYDPVGFGDLSAHIISPWSHRTEEDVETHLVETNRFTLPPGELLKKIRRDMKCVLAHIFEASRRILIRQPGCFELLGVDFLLDENLRVHLLELNANPSLKTQFKTQGDFKPRLIGSSLDLVLAAQRPGHQNSLPVAPSPFELVVDEANGFVFT